MFGLLSGTTIRQTSPLDVCVIVRGDETTKSVEAALRPHDQLTIRDNTNQNIGFAAGHNESARKGTDHLLHQP